MSGGSGFAERWAGKIEAALDARCAGRERSGGRLKEFARSAMACIEQAGHGDWPPIDAECNEAWVGRPVSKVVNGTKITKLPEKGTKRTRRWALREIYEAAAGCGAAIPEPLNPVSRGPADIATVLAAWRPRSIAAADMELVADCRATLEDWVVAAEPRDAADARFLMVETTRMAIRMLKTLQSASKEVVLNERNAKQCIEEMRVAALRSGCDAHEMDLLVARHRKVLSALRRVSNAINPDGWAAKPPARGNPKPPPPYTEAEEYAFQREIGRVRNADPAERLWTGGTALGGGLSGAEIAAGCVEHVSVGEDGGLIVEVGGKRPRHVPILSRYASLVRQAMDAAESGPFILTKRKSPASGIAQQIQVDGKPLSLSRARSTWLRTHLSGGTPIDQLRVIAGPVSTTRMDALLSDIAAALDTREAAAKASGL